MPRMCGVIKHPLMGEGVLITNPRLVSFIQKSRPDFRPDDLVCLECRDTIKLIYDDKYRRARQMRDSRNGEVTTISSLSTHSDNSSRSSSLDSTDRLVIKTPMHQRKSKENGNVERNVSNEEQNRAANVLQEIRNADNTSYAKTPPCPMSSRNVDRTPLILSVLELSTAKPPVRTLARKHVTFAENSGLIYHPLNSPTVYTEEYVDDCLDLSISQQPRTIVTTATQPDIRLTQKPTTNAAATETVRFRMSQEPTTSAAATEMASIRLSQEPITSAAANVTTPKEILGERYPQRKRKLIREYFTPLQVNGDGNSSKTGPSNVITTAGNQDDSSVDSEDDEPRMSLNFYNPEVRRPDIQPIPKRRRFNHDNPDIMSMYLQGLTGG